MNIFKLIGQLALDATPFDAGLRQIKGKVNTANAEMAASIKSNLAAAFGSAAVIAAAKRTIDTVSKFHDDAIRAGVKNVEVWQQMAHWVTQAGAETTDLVRSFKDLANARDAALGGDAKKLGTFAAFGVDRAALEANDLETTFRKIVETSQKIDWGADTMPMLQEVLGKAALSLAPALAESISEAADEAQRLGIIIKKDVVDNIEAAGDSIDALITATRGPFAQFISWIASGLRNAFTLVELLTGSAFSAFGELSSSKSPRKAAGAYLDYWNKGLDKWEGRGDGAQNPEREKRRRDREAAALGAGAAGSSVDQAMQTEERIARLKEKIWELDFKTLSVAEKKIALQQKLKEIAMEEWQIKRNEFPGGLTQEEKARLLELEVERKQLWERADHLNEAQTATGNTGNTARPEVAALTRVGQFEGRAFMNAPESESVRTARQILGVNKAAVEKLTSLDNKVERGGSLNGSL
jgi:hypothetical protein